MQRLGLGMFSLILFLSPMAPDSLFAGTYFHQAFWVQTVDEKERYTVSGILDEKGEGYVVVNGVRFNLNPDHVVKDKDGREIAIGLKGLRPLVEVELLLKDDLVEQVQQVELAQ